MHLHVIVRMRGSVENGARGVGAVLMGGKGIEGFGEGGDGGECLVCGEGFLRECGGCGESGKREAECAARGVHVRNGTPGAQAECCNLRKSKAVGPGPAQPGLWMGTHPWLESKTIPVTEDGREDTP